MPLADTLSKLMLTNNEQQTNTSSAPKSNTSKLAFALGLVSGIAVISLIGFLFLLARGGGANVGADNNSGGTAKIAKKFKACLDSGKYSSKVQDQAKDAAGAGGTGTPYNVVIGPDGKKVPISGAFPIEAFSEVIDDMLKDGITGNDASADEASLNKPQEITLNEITQNDHIRGSVDSPVKIVEYSDLECPFCKRHHDTMKEVINKYGEDKVAWIYRHLPLASLHSKAPKEAEATECAAELGGNDGFWKLTDKIFEVTPANNGLDLEILPSLAYEVGLE